jgi:uncharacterized protein YjlB
VILLETIKRVTQKGKGARRPDDLQCLVRKRRPVTLRFKDDGLIPNHPRWPLIIYRGAVEPSGLDPAAVFEQLSDSHGWRSSWRNGIYDYAHYHSSIHEVLGIARGNAQVRFGGTQGRIVNLQAGDVAILPAGTGHQSLKASADLLVVGAYPAAGSYDECSSEEDREKAIPAIERVPRPAQDPVYGKDGPLIHIWPPLE